MKLWEWLHFKNIYESILEGNFKIDGNTKVLILTEAEIVAFRKKGYDVEIVKKISPSYPRRIVTIGYTYTYTLWLYLLYLLYLLFSLTTIFCLSSKQQHYF